MSLVLWTKFRYKVTRAARRWKTILSEWTLINEKANWVLSWSIQWHQTLAPIPSVLFIIFWKDPHYTFSDKSFWTVLCIWWARKLKYACQHKFSQLMSRGANSPQLKSIQRNNAQSRSLHHCKCKQETFGHSVVNNLSVSAGNVLH